MPEHVGLVLKKGSPARASTSGVMPVPRSSTSRCQVPSASRARIVTEPGRGVASRIYERHCVLSQVLMALGTDEDTAYHDACKIEHDLSDETFDNIRAYYNKHKKK